MAVTIESLLLRIKVHAHDLRDCDNVADELVVLRRKYLTSVRRDHPDKASGNAVHFREDQESWEALRNLYEMNALPAEGFRFYFTPAGSTATVAIAAHATSAFQPAADWYDQIAEDFVPPYKVRQCARQRAAPARGGRDPL